MNSNSKMLSRSFVLLIGAVLLLAGSGCVSQLGALMYMIKGANVPPEFDGLAKKRVAVVCQSDSSTYGPDKLAYTVSKFVSQRLVAAPDEITVVSPVKVEEFIDLNGWSDAQAEALGQFCDADVVLVISISDYSIHEGETLYKGRAEVEITAYDVQDGGSLLFSKGPEQYAYPENGRPALQTTDRQFEAFYLGSLTNHIARMLVTHDKMEGFANEAIMN